MATPGTIIIYKAREFPSWDFWIFDGAGTIANLSTGWTFTTAIRQAGTDTTITTVVTANATPSGDGTAAADVSTLNVAPAAAALDNLTVGPATIIIVGTSGTKDREWQFPAQIRD